MLPEQFVAGSVYDRRLQIGCREVCKVYFCTRNHFKFRILFFYPSVLTLFRYSSDNPGSECIDLQLNDLFMDLKADTAQTYNITRKLSIDRGANKHTHTQTLSRSVNQDTYLKAQGQRRLLELVVDGSVCHLEKDLKSNKRIRCYFLNNCSCKHVTCKHVNEMCPRRVQN